MNRKDAGEESGRSSNHLELPPPQNRPRLEEIGNCQVQLCCGQAKMYLSALWKRIPINSPLQLGLEGGGEAQSHLIPNLGHID